MDKLAPREHEDDRRQLPPRVAAIPTEYDCPKSQTVQLGLAKVDRQIQAYTARARTAFSRCNTQDGYHDLYAKLGGDPRSLGHWRLDAEFGRQRLDGVNPMHARCLRDPDFQASPLWEAAASVVAGTCPKYDLPSLFKAERLYVTDYSILWHSAVQSEVKKAARRGKLPVRLAAPTCLFWEDDEGRFMPLAIRLKPADVEEHNPVITPLHQPGDWQMARAHVSCADGTLHEGFYHLLETHLVNEAVALACYRQLHPDHPLRQLLTPHYQGTLAINAVARDHLLSTEGSGGPIQRSMAGGVAGTLNAACLAYKDWSFPARGLEADLAARGMNKLRNYHYRDDARDIHAALRRFVSELLGLWYREDADVRQDFELQDFLREVGSPQGGAIPGFPQPADGESVATRIDTRDKLFALVTDLVFRAGPQHAAVNNGQFDTYGEVANGPGRLHGELPTEASLDVERLTEADFWRRLPAKSTAIAQMSMVWVLSLPTRRSILQTGQFPDMSPLLSLQVVEAIASLRRELQSISYDIQARNGTLAVPYRYLDPENVSLSTDV